MSSENNTVNQEYEEVLRETAEVAEVADKEEEPHMQETEPEESVGEVLLDCVKEGALVGCEIGRDLLGVPGWILGGAAGASVGALGAAGCVVLGFICTVTELLEET